MRTSSANPVGSAHEIRFEFIADATLQVDGEPFEQQAGTVLTIRFLEQALMLAIED
jgi:hypothetical protein